MVVYILRSRVDNSFYIGLTKNIEQRLKSHNRRCNISTKSKAPWDLVKIENFESYSLALKREKYLKSGNGRKVLLNICSERKLVVD